jgi:hypothetical protein
MECAQTMRVPHPLDEAIIDVVARSEESATSAVFGIVEV